MFFQSFYHHTTFRLKQALRIFNLNPRFSLPILLLLGGLVIVKLPENWAYPLAFFILILVFHFRRKDLDFLQKIFVKHWRLVIYFENAILFSIFLLANINYQLDVFGGLALVFLGCFSFILPKKNSNIICRWNFIPDSLFEWRSFLRQHTLGFIVIYIILLISTYYQASFILFGLLVSDYLFFIFNKNENKEMLKMYFSEIDFNLKIKKNLYFLNGLLLPAYVVFILINTDYSDYLLFFIVFINLYYLLVIIGKYKNYHHKLSGYYYNMGISLQYFFCSVTIFPAVFLIWIDAKKARKNIKYYVGN
ncbi:MAG: hypothetical protein Q4G16_09635 [Cruoricaptor ignavus]|nr:hypothetical protein [Cruoricaptor ignavus]